MYRRTAHDIDSDSDASDDSDAGDAGASRATLFAHDANMNFTQAAAKLLRSALTPNEVLTRLVMADLCDSQALATSSCFKSHEKLLLPCSRSPVAVHRFSILPEISGPLTTSLAKSAASQRRVSTGILVSNAGGWHSCEEILDPEAAGNEPEAANHWACGLEAIVSAAVGAGEGRAPDGVPSSGAVLGAREVSGWLNSSGRRAYNTMHDHGRVVEWSLVLFVCTGEEAVDVVAAAAAAAATAAAVVTAAEAATAAAAAAATAAAAAAATAAAAAAAAAAALALVAGDIAAIAISAAANKKTAPQVAACSLHGEHPEGGSLLHPEGEHPEGGSLLLKTQPDVLEPNKQSYLAIPSSPGELWLFPGSLLHAVLPRELGPDRNFESPCTQQESEQRVSVAFNVYKRV